MISTGLSQRQRTEQRPAALTGLPREIPVRLGSPIQSWSEIRTPSALPRSASEVRFQAQKAEEKTGRLGLHPKTDSSWNLGRFQRKAGSRTANVDGLGQAPSNPADLSLLWA